jgi:hypothetical protein
MGKIKHDKYYTPDDVVKYIVDKTKEVIGAENITEFIEPSAGNGIFLNHLPDNTMAYDIEPEDDRIIKQDYLDLELDYKTGRVVIGNPPFGNRNNLARKFCNKSFEIAEYVAFIMPISQLNNTYSIYKYDLIYSSDLGVVKFSDREVHICFNIYKRPKDGFNKLKASNFCNLIELKEVLISRNQFLPKDFKYDIGICSFGSVGELVYNNNKYSSELYIKVLDDNLKEEIVECIKNADWCKEFSMTKSPRLKQWQVNKYIKDNFKVE